MCKDMGSSTGVQTTYRGHTSEESQLFTPQQPPTTNNLELGMGPPEPSLFSVGLIGLARKTAAAASPPEQPPCRVPKTVFHFPWDLWPLQTLCFFFHDGP